MDKRLNENISGKQHDYMAPFLWLHGEDPRLVIEELEHVYESGIRSVCFESRTHEGFCEEQWWSDMRVILPWCREKGVKVWILDDKHFPSGHANGAFYRKENDHLRPWGITERHIDVSGPVTEGCAMADCWKRSEEDEIIAVLACRHVPSAQNYTQVMDITDGLQDGMVYFDLPEGMWRIVFVIKTRTGLDDFGQYYCDMLSAESVKVFVDEVYEGHYVNLKEFFGDPLLGFFSDEPSFRSNVRNTFITQCGKHFAHYPWHDKLLPMLDEALEGEGRRMLPGLWFDVGDISDRFRHAYMDLISREYSHNYCSQIADWCHSHDLEYIGHVIEDNNAHAMTGHGTAHYFRALWDQDMSGIDIVLHQIVPGLTECSNSGSVCYEHMDNEFFHYYLGKLASSLAHIDPKKQGRAMCEIFGAFGWAEGLPYMKGLADIMLASGINYFVPHAFSPKEEDPDCPPHFYNGGKNVQYPLFKNLMDYMGRCAHTLRGGIHRADVAVFYNAEGEWTSGANRPFHDVCRTLTQHLIDFDIIPADVLETAQVEGNKLQINGESYGALIISHSEILPADRLACFARLARAGLPILFTDALPTRAAEGTDIADLLPLYEAVTLDSLPDALRARGLCHVSGEGRGLETLRFYHVIKDGEDIYLFSNEAIRGELDAILTLPQGGDCLIYEPWDNRCFRTSAPEGKLHLRIEKGNMLFVVFGTDIPEDIHPNELINQDFVE